MAAEWHVVKDGKQHGPFSAAQLRQLAANGRISRTDLLWKAGMEKGVPCGSVKGLFDMSPRATANAPPLPPPGPSGPPALPSTRTPSTISQGVGALGPNEWPFKQDRFLLAQRFAINSVYDVTDADGTTLLCVYRPRFLGQSILALFLAAIVTVVVFVIAAAIGAGIAQTLPDPARGVFAAIGAVVTLLAGVTVALFVGSALYPLRPVTFHPDASRSQTLLSIRQNSRLVLMRHRYTVMDAQGVPIATLSKNILYDLFRKRWICADPQGTVLCMAFEDSILKSILRRFVGPLMGLLRTNFIITAAEGPDGRTLGRFDRRWTIRDRYVLDMTADTPPSIDRRIALALGVMLDTGENR